MSLMSFLAFGNTPQKIRFEGRKNDKIEQKRQYKPFSRRLRGRFVPQQKRKRKQEFEQRAAHKNGSKKLFLRAFYGHFAQHK